MYSNQLECEKKQVWYVDSNQQIQTTNLWEFNLLHQPMQKTIYGLQPKYKLEGWSIMVWELRKIVDEFIGIRRHILTTYRTIKDAENQYIILLMTQNKVPFWDTKEQSEQYIKFLNQNYGK